MVFDLGPGRSCRRDGAIQYDRYSFRDHSYDYTAGWTWWRRRVHVGGLTISSGERPTPRRHPEQIIVLRATPKRRNLVVGPIAGTPPPTPAPTRPPSPHRTP